MSHVTTINLEVKDLDALGAACQRLGLDLVRGQQTYRWYGQHVGDHPLPEGFAIEDLGKCDHAIRVSDATLHRDGFGARKPYEIGVARRRDGKPGYVLLYDHWANGQGMSRYVGGEDASGGCGKLKQAYALVVAKRQAMRQGFQVREEQRADGSIRLQMSKA